MTEAWIDRMPPSVTDLFNPHGELVTTPTDRRMLWHIESVLSVNAPIGSRLAQLGRDLRSYLNETCGHHWSEYQPDPDNESDVPAHRQCLWCHDVEWLAPDAHTEETDHG
jgi:hypothetical protein